jgi:LacI family transcriptional regulator
MPTMTRQDKRTKVSLKDIAREAQCSIAVASTVLNATKGCSVVSDSLRERVQTVAKRLNYRPHFASQSLIRGRTNTLGVYNPPGHRNGVGDGYAGRLLDGIELECLSHGYDLLLTNRVNEGSGETCLKKLAEQRVDGLIIFRSSLCSDWLPMLKSYASRVVLMDAEALCEPFHAVVFDNAGAIGKAVEYLAGLGHSRIGFLGSCLDKPQAPWLLRQQGYVQAMRALGLPG